MNRIGSTLSALSLAALAACGPGTAMMDTDAGDGGMTTDAPRDTAPSAPRVCDPSAIIDLSTAGMRAGMRTTYTGTTANAGTTMQITPPANCFGESYPPSRQVAHTYRMQSAAYLRVSTDVAATPSMGDAQHDTGVWIMNTCDTRGTTAYGCSDDIDTEGGNYRSTAVSNRLLPAGTMVTIVVASVVPMAMASTAPGAAYGLLVEEVAPIAAGAMCDAGADVDLCADGNTCLAEGTMPGRCVANGTRFATRCRTGNMCDAGLTCVPGEEGNPSYCYRAGTLNMPCNFEETQCPTGSSCVGNSVTDSYNGICRTDGSRGGLCNTMTACMMGLTCSATGDNTGYCRSMGTAGGECDPLGAMTACPMNSQCVPAGTMGSGATMFVCAAQGTAQGTACREGASRCDMGLACSSMATAGHCTREVASGAECDPLFGTTRCAGTDVCRRTSAAGAGTCGAATMEPAGDNNLPAMAGAAITLPATIRGSISPANDQDCFHVTVPAPGGSIFASVTDGMGGCPNGTAMSMGMPVNTGGDTQLLIVDPMDRVIASNDDSVLNVCSLIDGANPASGANNLAAGTYTVCLRSYQGQVAIASYTLHVAVTPRM